jgi:hypothetical protein
MTAPVYRPPTKVSTKVMPYLALVSQADPSFEHRKHRETEYEMASGKAFLADPYVRGLYNRRSNIYPVGQPQGDLDPVIQANLKPTVGVAVPGLFKAVPTGSWD